MKKKLWIISIVFLCIILIALLLITIHGSVQYCNFMIHSEVIEIDDVTRKTTILLTSESDPNQILGIIIMITGYIDGTAIIRQSWEEQGIQTYDIRRGKVSLKIGGDWYDSKCLIEYKPANVSSGRLKIRYKFYSVSSILDLV
jgi:hypothetical protein